LLTLCREVAKVGHDPSRPLHLKSGEVFLVTVIVAIGRLTMDSFGQKPFFCVVLRDGDRWLVEAEWPDGRIVEVDSFKAHLDALNWVKTQSQAWLQGR
jgi:hypothetical protein